MKAESSSPLSRPGRALAHTPHRPDGRPPHTPRGARRSGLTGRLRTLPPVPGRPVVVSVLLPLVFFLILTWQVAADGPLLSLDRALRDNAEDWAPPGGAVSAVAQFFADLGSTLVAVPVLVVGAVLCAYLRRSPVPLALALLAAVAVPLLVLPLKSALARTGPDGAPLGDYAGYYPSGHAATAAMAYGALALLYGGARRAPYAAVALLNFGVGAGLLLRGYHWGTDVVASWALAVPVLAALTVLCRRLTPPRPSGPPPPASPAPGRRDP